MSESYDAHWNCRTLLQMHTRTCRCGALCDLLAAQAPGPHPHPSGLAQDRARTPAPNPNLPRTLVVLPLCLWHWPVSVFSLRLALRTALQRSTMRTTRIMILQG